ncbi:hypothetical protein RM572_00750 [Streptomyces sp. DSM 42041]|uniref:Uncharacterized protein n=1 Tax=Streptomyces hazeniae TaxID=3075538 RepID=A0ABU2NJY4_9ACTN|nr:hypothetical protein [Streptomyces sp. DSM 42041]MDT0377304.1 hypothetical protein [Streptomyces sp. DSM 42041]
MFGLTTTARLHAAEQERDHYREALQDRAKEHLRDNVSAEQRINQLQRQITVLAGGLLDAHHHELTSHLDTESRTVGGGQ